MADFLDPDAGEEHAEDLKPANAEFTFDATELATAGWRDGICLNAQLGVISKSSGAPMIVLSIADPEDPKAASEYYLVNSPKAKWRFDQGLKAFGLEPPTPTKKQTYKREQFVGVKVRALGAHEVNPNFNGGQPTFKFSELAAATEGAGFRVFEADPA